MGLWDAFSHRAPGHIAPRPGMSPRRQAARRQLAKSQHGAWRKYRFRAGAGAPISASSTRASGSTRVRRFYARIHIGETEEQGSGAAAARYVDKLDNRTVSGSVLSVHADVDARHVDTFR